ncbi:hypothetical protein PanWU01x14_013760 [Parasponia andersonii]|uniref:Uncharacterized protein n=1 Tax=Parasponia andersonii TaxID=3476 RepID=A0A2P5E130_PARAD|nr:hypothetical protein PanWU01x14_013760 [Parasponia andersonii]
MATYITIDYLVVSVSNAGDGLSDLLLGPSSTEVWCVVGYQRLVQDAKYRNCLDREDEQRYWTNHSYKSMKSTITVPRSKLQSFEGFTL